MTIDLPSVYRTARLSCDSRATKLAHGELPGRRLNCVGLTITVEDENGDPVRASVQDTTNVLARVLPGARDTSFPLLRFVDPYSDTIFNRRQIVELRAECARLLEHLT